MEEFQGSGEEQVKGFDYNSVEGLATSAPQLGQSFSDPNNQQQTNNNQLASFNQYANYAISPQHSLAHAPQQQSGYNYDQQAIYNQSPQLVYNPQQSVNLNQPPLGWPAQPPVQSPHWLVSTQAQSSPGSVPSLVHSGTSSAVDSSRWTSAFNMPGSSSIQPNPYAVVPPMGTQSWEGDGASGLSSNARLKPFIEKLFNILAQPAAFRDCLVWDESGTAFIVSHANPRLLQQVLPDAFGHSNLHSFTRQLNIYGFTRCTSAELLSKLDVT